MSDFEDRVWRRVAGKEPTVTAALRDFPSGEHSASSLKNRNMVLSEKTIFVIGVSGLASLLAGALFIGSQWGAFQAAQKAQLERDTKQDQRLEKLEQWQNASTVWMATTSQDIKSGNEKLDTLLKINNVLLYSAGGDRKKVPAEN